MSTVPNSAPGTPQSSWSERTWKWALPVGCLGLIILIVLFVAAIFGIVEFSFKSSDVYQQALSQAQADVRVTSRIGQPLKPGFFATGEIHLNGSSGQAKLEIPVEGSKGKGAINLSAEKTQGRWRFLVLEFKAEGLEEPINLLQPDPPDRQPREQ